MSDWISVESEKPNGDECVDLWGSICGDYSHGDESRFENCFYDEAICGWWMWDAMCEKKIYLNFLNVTHWMHQPDPPQ